MPAIIQHNRGDVYLGNQQNFKTGQFFWSYINKDKYTSNGHSYSEGQLWIKDPSDENLTEIANRRSLNAFVFKGNMPTSFSGDFINAEEPLYTDMKHCHVGDFWIFEHNEKDKFLVPFQIGDILAITDTVYENVEGQPFRNVLTHVEYTRIRCAAFDAEGSNLTATTLSEAIKELELRLLYKGEFKGLREYYSLTKKKGWCYLSKEDISLTTNEIVLLNTEREDDNESFHTVRKGDFIWWNGETWVLIPTGLKAEDIPYTPNVEDIDAHPTFPAEHKELLKSTDNVQDAIDILNLHKASLDHNGKIPYDELPTSIRSGLVLQGIFYPVIDPSLDKDNPENQNPWPDKIDLDGNVLDNWMNGWFWIVNTKKKINVQYQDKLNPDRVVELNSGDFIVWVEQTGRFEIIDNSDRISAITVQIPKKDGDRNVTVVGNVGLTTTGQIEIKVEDGTIIIDGDKVVGLDTEGKKDYFPIFKDEHTLAVSDLHKQDDVIISDIGFVIGAVDNNRDGVAYGDLIIRKTVNTENILGWRNNFLIIENALFDQNQNVFLRQTNLRASTRNKLIEEGATEETLDIYMPESSSDLLAVLADEKLTPHYLQKTHVHGFTTDSLNSEIIEPDEYLLREHEDGYSNVGLGRTASEDVDLGEITFYAKTKDIKEDEDATGFYTSLHVYKNNDARNKNLTEHFVNLHSKSKTHLVINPTVIRELKETFVKMPCDSGTLLLWEDIQMLLGRGVPLMIPAWESMHHDVHDFVGLATSPITIKINREKSGWETVDRVNDLSKDYGPGDESTWSYIDSSKEGSLQDDTRGSIDDVVSFDSWVEAQRAIATKEAFLIPSTAKVDGNSHMDPVTLEVDEDSNEVKNDLYGRDKQGGKYQRILPSRTLYPYEHQYYDPLTGDLIPQNTMLKDVEMPACGGVLISSRSRIEGGAYGDVRTSS